MTSPTRVLHLAFDSCDGDTIRQLVAQGRMPNVAALMERSAIVDSIGPRGVYVGAHWTSMYTGRIPTNHGYYCWAKIDRDTYEWKLTSPHDTVGTRVWNALSDVGHRVAVFDVPHTFPEPGLDGALIAEWGCHDRHFGTQSHPAGLVEDISHRFGPHPVGTHPGPGNTPAFAACDYVHRAGLHRTPGENLALSEDLQEGVRRKAAASLSLLDQGDWSWFFSVFGETHCVGHAFWHLHDPAHARYDADAFELLGDPVATVYEMLDEAIGEHLERVDDDTTVYVHFTHGMGPNHDGTHMLDQILWRLDLARRGTADLGPRTRAARAVTSRLPRSLGRQAGRLAAPLVRRRVESAPPAPNPEMWTIDRAGRTYYDVPNNFAVGAIRINLMGRERHGRVAPGAELDRVLDQLRDDLLELVDIDTGRPAVLDVVRMDDIFPRHEVDDFPDLVVEWNRTSLIQRVWSPTAGTIVVPHEHWRTGDHHERGLFLAAGPGIEPGPRRDPLVAHDVAPTVAAALGHRLADADGAPRTDLLPSNTARAVAGAAASRRLATRRIEAMTSPAPTARPTVRPAPTIGPPAASAPSPTAPSPTTTPTGTDLDQLAARVDLLEREALVARTMAWLAGEPADPDGPVVTVVLPTRARQALLARAVRSVIAQRHERWQLVVVDNSDDGGDATAAVLDVFDDHRIELVRRDRPGLAGARNAGLDVAKGSIITYLDDDNELDPGWLHAVSWAFAQHAEHDVLFGARLIDDLDRVRGLPTRGWPWLHFHHYDRAVLERQMYTDMGAIAHRADIPDARFREDLAVAEDWELFLRLTRERPPLELPVIACRYRTDAADRMSHGITEAHLERIRTDHAATGEPNDPQ